MSQARRKIGPGPDLADAADEVLRLLGHNRPPLDEAAE